MPDSQTNPSPNVAIINSPDGDVYVLADCEADALAEAMSAYGEDDVEGIGWSGWMHQVPYPEDYGSREEWEQSPDFCESWWESCQTPVNDKQRANAKQAWTVRFR